MSASIAARLPCGRIAHDFRRRSVTVCVCRFHLLVRSLVCLLVRSLDRSLCRPVARTSKPWFATIRRCWESLAIYFKWFTNYFDFFSTFLILFKLALIVRNCSQSPPRSIHSSSLQFFLIFFTVFRLLSRVYWIETLKVNLWIVCCIGEYRQLDSEFLKFWVPNF